MAELYLILHGHIIVYKRTLSDTHFILSNGRLSIEGTCTFLEVLYYMGFFVYERLYFKSVVALSRVLFDNMCLK